MSRNTTSEYISRVNRSIDYIEEHIDEQFTLQQLASVANFSRFHFNRIFYGIMGETPFQFISRVRMGKAAMLLRNAPNDTISDIAMKCGFSELAVFSRNFKACYGMSASDYRKGKGEMSNYRQMHRNDGKALEPAESYFCPASKTLKWRTKMKTNKSVEIKDLPKMTLAYVRHVGPYAGNEKLFEGLWNRLFSWACRRFDWLSRQNHFRQTQHRQTQGPVSALRRCEVWRLGVYSDITIPKKSLWKNDLTCENILMSFNTGKKHC